MFYVKEQINYGTEINTVITDNNVYTKCPQCGIEHKVDLSDVFSDECADLETTLVFCEKCSKKMEEEDEY